MNKNVMWIGAACVAGVIGAQLGPSLAKVVSPGTMKILLVLILLGVAGFVYWALSNNKSAGAADGPAQTDARSFRAREGKARIYVSRRGFVGAMQGVNISISNGSQGQIKSGQMLMVDVDPGQFSIHAETAKKSLAKPTDLDVTLAAGDIAVVDARLEMGALKGSVILTRLGDDKAHGEVQAAKLMNWSTV